MAGLLTLWENYQPWTQAVVVAPLIARARSPWMKTVWYTVLCSTTAAFVLTSFYLFQDYFSYPTTTNIRLFSEPQVPFPAVTFCNLNPFKKTMVRHSQELTNLIAAYTYVSKVKQARMKSGTTAVAKTGSQETHSLKKRQSGAAPGAVRCSETAHSFSHPLTGHYAYSVWKCPNGTAYVEFTACDEMSPPRTESFPSSDIDSWMETMAGIYYQCFDHSCTTVGCGAYQDGLTAIVMQRGCLRGRTTDPSLVGIVAHALNNYCAYSDANCSVGMTAKKGSYDGFYYHRQCGNELTTVFEGCNGGEISINYTHPYDTKCEKGQYITEMASLVVDAMRCGAPCKQPPCIYDKTDACAGLHYNDLLCALSTCNVSTTSSFTSSTMPATTFATTVEQTTTETPSTSTMSEKTATSSDTLTTTAAPLTSTIYLSTTGTGVSTAVTESESTTSKPTTTETDPTTTTPMPWTSTTATKTVATATTTDETSNASSTSTTTAESATEVQSTALASKPETTTTPTTPIATRSAITESTVPQETTNLKLSSTHTTFTTTEKAMSQSTSSAATSTTVPGSTASASQPTRAPLSVLPTAYGTTTETQTTTTTMLLPSTTVSADMSSTYATSTTLNATSTQPPTSPASVESTTPTQGSTSKTTPGRTSTISTTPGSSTMTSGGTSPNEASSLASTVAIPTLSTSSKTRTTIHSTRPTDRSSSYVSDGFSASSDGPITKATHAAQESKTHSSTTRSSKGAATTAPAEGVISSTFSESTTATARHSSSTPSSSSMQATESSTEPRSGIGSVRTTSAAATSELAYTVGVPAGSSETETAMTDSKLTSVSSTLSQSTLSAATISAGDKSSLSSNAPSTISLGPVGDSGRPDSSANPIYLYSPSATTENGMQSSKVPKSSRSTAASSPAKSTATRVRNDLTTTVRMLASSSLQNGEGTGSTTGAEGHQITTLNPTVKPTTQRTGQMSSSTTGKGIESTPSTGDVDGGQDRSSSPSVTSGRPKDSTVVRITSASATENDEPLKSSTETTNVPSSPRRDDEQKTSTAAQNRANDTTPTTGSRSNADPSFSFTPSTTILQSKEPTPSSPLPTESRTDGGQSGTSMPTVNDHGQSEQKSTTQKGGSDPNKIQSTTRSFVDAGNHATTASDGNVPDGGSTHGSTSTTATTGPPNGSDDHATKEPNEEGDGSDTYFTTGQPDQSGNVLTTTNYGDYLKNIKLDLSTDFGLEDLDEEQTKNLEDLSNAYGLDPANSQVVIDSIMKQALQTVAAKMSPELRQTLGFKLKELVSSCIMDGEPCDMFNDFVPIFDVDYGNCYTFNHETPAKYVTRRAGSSRGLRMVIMSNTTESLPSSSEQGVKVIVHDQEIAPFPNVQGLRAPVGQMVSLQLTQSKLSKLGAPHGNCSTLESVAENKQPFYYNGPYSIDGCLRSCFQRNIATACECADSRFPPPTDMNVPFCDPLDPAKYKCKEAYIQDIGDYFFVDNCQCYDACENTAYTAQMSESNWPAGSFFYGPYCPMAEKMNLSCREFYSNNGMTLEVSFATLGYEMKQQEPVKTAWGLVNDLAGNSGLWIGYTMLSFVECILISIQICLWVCRCPKELPEVPSCRRRNFWADIDEGSDSDRSSDGEGSTGCHGANGESNEPYAAVGKACRKRSAVSRWRVPPKNFDNSFGEKVLTRRKLNEMMSAQLELYGPQQEFE